MNIIPPTNLYHYTNQKGLLGILSSNSLWLTNIHYLNDSKEFKYTFQTFQNRFNYNYLDTDDDKFAFYLRELGKNMHHFESTSIFVFSLSQEGDLLSQWRAYGSSFNGYSIKFNSEKLKKHSINKGYSLIQCKYKSDENNEIIDNLFQKYCSYYEKNNKILESQDMKKIFKEFYIDLLNIAPLIKNSYFHEEREWRIITNPLDVDNNLINIEHREGKYSIIPYTRLEFSENIDSPIEEIIVGPTNNQELSVKSVESLLRENKINAKVTVSDLPYRDV